MPSAEDSAAHCPVQRIRRGSGVRGEVRTDFCAAPSRGGGTGEAAAPRGPRSQAAHEEAQPLGAGEEDGAGATDDAFGAAIVSSPIPHTIFMCGMGGFFLERF